MRTFLTVSALVLLSATAVPVQKTDPALEVRVNITPTIYSEYQLLKRPAADTYTCEVSVVDPPRGSVHATLIATPGLPAEVTKKNGDYEVQFKVDISKSGETADARVTARHDGVVVARQSSIVRLMKMTGKPYKPLQ